MSQPDEPPSEEDEPDDDESEEEEEESEERVPQSLQLADRRSIVGPQSNAITSDRAVRESRVRSLLSHSVPRVQSLVLAPRPPSSQLPSSALGQVLSHSTEEEEEEEDEELPPEQSLQSVPKAQSLVLEPGPPSSQLPLSA